MVVGSMTVDTQVAIIGAGPGGYVAAIRAAQLGKDVTLIEIEPHLGGDCLHHGCIPTKALIHASNFYNVLRDLKMLGIDIKDYTVDFQKMHAWKDGILERLNRGIQGLLTKYGVEVIQGKAVFTSSNSLRIEGKSDVTGIKFQNAIIATGSRPFEVPGFPFGHEGIISSKEALQLKEIFKKLIIIGGGYIGTEMGTVYGKLGTEVHIIEMMDRLIPQLDGEIVKIVADKLEQFNVHTHIGSKALGFEMKGGRPHVKILENGKESVIDGDKILVVVGRTPNSNGFGLEATKVKVDTHGFIEVDKQMRTADPKIFAIGDVIGQPMLAHKSSRQGKIAAEVISGKNSAFDNKVIPFVVFNDPEIASVGLTEQQARDQGYDIIIGRFPFNALGRALTINQTDGFVKVIAEKESKMLLGVHAVGPGVSDMISEAALAIEMGANTEDIALTIHPHPTLPESLMEAAEVTLGKGIHIYTGAK